MISVCVLFHPLFFVLLISPALQPRSSHGLALSACLSFLGSLWKYSPVHSFLTVLSSRQTRDMFSLSSKLIVGFVVYMFLSYALHTPLSHPHQAIVLQAPGIYRPV